MYPIDARLVYAESDDSADLNLVWQIEIFEDSRMHYWHGHVDALTGEVTYKHDQMASRLGRA